MSAHLVDRVIPRVPVRQWVLSVPRRIRYLLARDAKLLSAVRRIVVAELFRDLRRRAEIRRASEGRAGAVTAIQRFGSALNLNVHFHSIVLDGLYVGAAEEGGAPRFRRLAAPSRDDMDRVLSRVRFRVLGLLERRGLLEEEGGGFVEEVGEPSIFDAVQAASIQERMALEGAGRRVPAVGAGEAEGAWPEEKPFCVVSGDGWSLQAGVRIRAGDRAGLERLCRYVLRPALSVERLERLPDGRIAYGFRRPRFDGATHVVLTPLELMEKLCALVAPPRTHLVTYDGVLAPHARGRRDVVSDAREPEGLCGPWGHGGGRDGSRDSADPVGPRDRGRDRRSGAGEVGGAGARRRAGRRTGRTPWAELMLRSMGLDVLWCPRCGGRMEVIACITDAAVAERILRAMGLPAEVPDPAVRRRPPPDSGIDFVQDGVA